MKSAILSIGTELLFGKVVNTNAAFLSQELNELGIDVMYHYTLGDNPGRLKRVLDIALEDCDLVVCTGGLGPTEDDLTKETIAEKMGMQLVLNDAALAEIKAYFDRTKFIWTENNLKQAYLPDGATCFRNGAGTAPGFCAEKDGKMVICMPGVPREMKYMWEHEVRPFLLKLSDAYIYSEAIRVFGIGESMIETKLLPFIDGQTDPTIATYAKEGQVEVRITSKNASLDAAKAAVKRMAEGVMAEVGASVFTTEGKELYEVVGEKLIARGISISIAESVTAGSFSADLVKVPGISAVYDAGIVAYSREAKVKELGVPEALLDERGTYSAEVAEAMARGLFERTASRLCVAITGVAGPGESEGVDAGTYYISVLYDGALTTRRFEHSGRTRQLNRDFMTLNMFDMVNHIIDGTALPY